MSGDLIAFLNARLDEDEAITLAGAKYEGKDWEIGPLRHYSDAPPDATIFDDDGANIVADSMMPETAAFIVVHRPRRELREIEAKRAILVQYEELLNPKTLRERALFPSLAEVLMTAIRQLAAVYSDHPDYDPAWSPEA